MPHPIDSLITETEREIAALEGKLAGLRLARKTVVGKIGHRRLPRSGVKQTVIDLLQEVGAEGLNASTAINMASARNIELGRGTVSSLLSRMKNEGVVDYDGTVYRLTTGD